MEGKFRPFLSFLKRFNTWILQRAERIVVIGEDMKQGFLRREFASEKIVRICDWVDLKFIRLLPQRNQFSESKDLTDKFVVLYAGNLGRIHNLEDLLGAAEQFRNRQEIQFVFVGGGALRKKLIQETRLRELANVKFFPFEVRSKLPEVLASAGASVILLRKGMAGLSVPSKIYSILASGRPILACVEEESDITRIVRGSRSGFVVPPGNPQALAQAIEELFTNQDQRDEMGRNGRHYAETMDYQNRALRSYAELFNNVLLPAR